MDINVTQQTSVSTAVTANGESGQITCFTSTLASVTTTTFTVNCTAARATGFISCGVVGYTGTYVTNGIPVVTVNNIVDASSFDIKITNVGANALAGVLKIGFRCI